MSRHQEFGEPRAGFALGCPGVSLEWPCNGVPALEWGAVVQWGAGDVMGYHKGIPGVQWGTSPTWGTSPKMGYWGFIGPTKGHQGCTGVPAPQWGPSPTMGSQPQPSGPSCW